MTNHIEFGNVKAKLVLVQDRPSSRAWVDQDVTSGRGSSNLSLILTHAQIPMNRYSVVCANPQNIPEKEILSARGQLTERGTQLQSGLLNLLNERSPDVIVPMGRLSCRFLLQDQRLQKLRGSLFHRQNPDSAHQPAIDTKVIPTYNPYTSGFNAAERFVISADLRKAYSHVGTGYSSPTMHIKLDPGYAEADQYLKDDTLYACDIEILNGQIYCIGFAKDTTSALVINFDKRSMPERIALWQLVAKTLSSPNKAFIGQNFIFDMHMLWKLNNVLVSSHVEDTMVAHHICFPDFEKSLQFLTSMYTDLPYYKDEGNSWKTGIYDRPQFLRYNGKDCIATYQVWEAIKHHVEKESTTARMYEQYRSTLDLYLPLISMMARGIKVDMSKLGDVKKIIAEEIETLNKTLQSTVADESDYKVTSLNFNSPKQCKDYYYDTLGIPAYKEKGKATANDTALTRLAKGTKTRKGLYSAQLIQQLRGRSKLYSTYLDMELDNDSRFRMDYKPRGTVTGRLSSSQTPWGSGMNAQNIPPEMKNFIVADKGHQLIEMDKRQSEWVLSAYIANDLQMIEVLESGVDPHASTGSMITGIPTPVIYAENKAVGHTTNPEEIAKIRNALVVDSVPFELATRDCFVPRSMAIRQLGKKCNHALNYMMGDHEFSLRSGMQIDECEEARKKYLAGYSALPDWWRDVEGALRDCRTVVNIFKYPRKFIGPIDRDMIKGAVAHIPQSSSAWIINHAMADLYTSTASSVKPATLVTNVHDSLMFQYPAEDLDNLQNFCWIAKKAFEPVLTSPAGREFVVETDMKIGFSWGQMVETSFDKVKETAWKLLQALE